MNELYRRGEIKSMEQDMITFELKITEKDYRSFNAWYLWGRPSGKCGLIICLYILIMIPVLLFLYSKDNTPYLLFMAGFASLYELIYLVILPLTVLIQSRRIFNSDKFLAEVQKYEVNVEYINLSSVSSKNTIKWTDIYKFIETKKYIYIMLAKNKALIIPKEKISDEQLYNLINISKAVNVNKNSKRK